MSEDQKKQLQTQLWNIANELRGKMGAEIRRIDAQPADLDANIQEYTKGIGMYSSF